MKKVESATSELQARVAELEDLNRQGREIESQQRGYGELLASLIRQCRLLETRKNNLRDQINNLLFTA